MSEAALQQMTPEQEQTFAMYITVAQVVHNVNRAFCQSIGDDSQVPWDQAPDWQVQSAIDGVAFHIANPDAGPDQSHKNWMAQKTRDGWVFGKEKRPELKMHPCMVPYAQLPQTERSKDYLIKAICEEFAVIFGMREPVVEEEVKTVGKVERPQAIEVPEPSRIILA